MKLEDKCILEILVIIQQKDDSSVCIPKQ